MAKKKKPVKPKRPAPKKKAAKKPAPKKAKKAAKPKARARAAKAAEPAPQLPWRTPLKGETLVGVVDDFFGHISVIAFKLQGALRTGDKIHVRGHTTDIIEPVNSMQMEHQPLESGKAGDSIGIKTVGKCRAGDYVYRVS